MYMKNIKSLENLKEQYKVLARKNHPDAGGDPEVMKAINAEYDQLFPIWKTRHNETAATPTDETAYGTRSEFYTANGWKGDKYDSNMSLKEIAKNIRAYVKALYPNYKFSIRTEYYSMGQALHVALVEAPADIYVPEEEWTEDQRYKFMQDELHLKSYHFSDEAITEKRKTAFYTSEAQRVLDDVTREIKCYNYEDIDSMIDYYNVKFHFIQIEIGRWDKDFKVVPKDSHVEKKTAEQATEEAPSAEVSYTVTEDVHTKTNEKLWVVKVSSSLTKEAFADVRKQMKDLGGYYSRFKHGFIFMDDPGTLSLPVAV